MPPGCPGAAATGAAVGPAAVGLGGATGAAGAALATAVGGADAADAGDATGGVPEENEFGEADAVAAPVALAVIVGGSADDEARDEGGLLVEMTLTSGAGCADAASVVTCGAQLAAARLRASTTPGTFAAIGAF